MERETFVLQFIEFSIDTGGSVFSPKHKIHHQREEKKQKQKSLSWLGKLDYTDDHLHIRAQEGNNKTRKEDTRNTCLPE